MRAHVVRQRLLLGSNDANELATTSAPLDCIYSSMPSACTGTPTLIGGLSGIQHLYAGGETTCALDASHHTFCWGDNEFGQLATGDDDPYPSPQKLLDSVSGNALTFDDMAVGRFSVCARDGDGLYCWGAGVLGTQTDAGTPDPYHPAPVQF